MKKENEEKLSSQFSILIYMKSQYLETLDNILARHFTVILLLYYSTTIFRVKNNRLYLFLFLLICSFPFYLFVLSNIRKLDRVPSTEWSTLYMLSY